MINITINRHILTDLVKYDSQRNECYIEFVDQWSRLSNAADKGDTLYWTKCVDEVQKIKELRKTRREFFGATKKISRLMMKISEYTSNQESLLHHLISAVKIAEGKNGKTD